MSIDENTRLKRSSTLLETDVDGEIVALDVQKGQCYGLDAVGSEIWRMLEEEVSVQDICTELSSRYQVDPQTCLTDVLKLIRELHEEGLIAVEDR